MKLDPREPGEDLQALLPPGVHWAQGAVGDEHEPTASEARLSATWSAKRRREYLLGRTLVRQICARIGIEAGDLLPMAAGGPSWPADHVGSLSHSRGVALALLAARADCASIGVDVEIKERLKERHLTRICTPAEHTWLRGLARRESELAAGLFFSAKESLYKCQHPLTDTFLGFQDVELELDMQSGSFRSRLLREGVRRTSGAALSLSSFEGRFLLHGDLIVTVCWLPRSGGA